MRPLREKRSRRGAGEEPIRVHFAGAQMPARDVLHTPRRFAFNSGMLMRRQHEPSASEAGRPAYARNCRSAGAIPPAAEDPRVNAADAASKAA